MATTTTTMIMRVLKQGQKAPVADKSREKLCEANDLSMYVCMYDSGCPCGDVHGTDSRLGQGERSLKTYFPNPNNLSMAASVLYLLP